MLQRRKIHFRFFAQRDADSTKVSFLQENLTALDHVVALEPQAPILHLGAMEVGKGGE